MQDQVSKENQVFQEKSIEENSEPKTLRNQQGQNNLHYDSQDIYITLK